MGTKTISTKEVANLTHRSPSAISGLAKNGLLPAKQGHGENGRKQWLIEYTSLDTLKDKILELVPRGGFKKRAKYKATPKDKKRYARLRKPPALDGLAQTLAFHALEPDTKTALMMIGALPRETVLLLVELSGA